MSTCRVTQAASGRRRARSVTRLLSAVACSSQRRRDEDVRAQLTAAFEAATSERLVAHELGVEVEQLKASLAEALEAKAFARAVALASSTTVEDQEAEMKEQAEALRRLHSELHQQLEANRGQKSKIEALEEALQDASRAREHSQELSESLAQELAEVRREETVASVRRVTHGFSGRLEWCNSEQSESTAEVAQDVASNVWEQEEQQVLGLSEGDRDPSFTPCNASEGGNADKDKDMRLLDAESCGATSSGDGHPNAELHAYHVSICKKEAAIEALHTRRKWLMNELQAQEQQAAVSRRAAAEAHSKCEESMAVAADTLHEVAMLRSQHQDLLVEMEVRDLRDSENRIALAMMNAELQAHRRRLDAEVSARAHLLEQLGNARSEMDSCREASEAYHSEAMRLRHITEVNMDVKAISAEELSELTDSFSRRIGAGGFGDVFAGKGIGAEWRSSRLGSLPADGQLAVKVIARNSSQAAEAHFLREVCAGTVRDAALVPLLAVCLERRALIYPLAVDNLEDRLRASAGTGFTLGAASAAATNPEVSSSPPLDPNQALHFLLGAARGLLALHDRGVVHQDVKSANIFIFVDSDGEEVARLGDCGLAASSVMDRQDSNEYLDPCAHHWPWSSPYLDVFAFGVIVLEVAVGRSITLFKRDPRPLWQQLREALPTALAGADLAVAAAATAFARGAGAWREWTSQALESVALLAVHCLQEVVYERPNAAVLAARLEEALRVQKAGLHKPQSLGKTLADVERICTICFDEPISARFRPCCHSVACTECAGLFANGQCPLCRCDIDSIENGFFQNTFSPGG
mmetsp:Transcript_3004/g.6659  ORF Transcript_3004/g.6659 Transcript_3004/m.6659 type:complete len:811 (+) Transcript_3004:58-2490(+)